MVRAIRQVSTPSGAGGHGFTYSQSISGPSPLLRAIAIIKRVYFVCYVCPERKEKYAGNLDSFCLVRK